MTTCDCDGPTSRLRQEMNWKDCPNLHRCLTHGDGASNGCVFTSVSARQLKLALGFGAATQHPHVLTKLIMKGDQMNQNDGANFTTTVADYLGMQAARLINLKGTPPIGQITFRLTPSESLACSNIALTQEQCLRLRDDLNSLLTDPTSWLFTEGACMSPRKTG